ncbi:ABC transporter ATP-binding protein [soil metagenome]
MIPALETHGLKKRFGKVPWAVNGVSLHVPRRAIYGFLGANGAGKTTTIKLLLGLLRPDEGSIRLFGEDMRAARSRPIGALVETPALYDHLTGIENLDLTRRILGLPRVEITRVLSIVELTDAGNRRAGGYSLGMRQRLGIARALLGSPRLLILDEPTNGLDPDGIRDMRDLLRRLPATGDVTLIVSSHQLGEIEQVASHVGLLHQGKLLTEAPLAELLGGPRAIEVATEDRARSALLLREAGFDVAETATDRLMVRRREGREADPSQIAALLIGRGQALSHLARHRQTLENVYHAAVQRAA